MKIRRCFSVVMVGVALTFAVSAPARDLATGLSANGHVADTDVSPSPDFRFVELRNGVQFQLKGTVKTILFYAPDVVRVNASLGRSHWGQPSLVVTEGPQSARYELRWNDAQRTLSIGARQGSFPGLIAQRRLNIAIVDPTNASAIAPSRADRSVTYEGGAMTLRFGG